MKFKNFVTFLFLLHGTSFCFVKGQTDSNEKTDCTKYYNYLNDDDKDYSTTCCSKNDYRLKCDYENYITHIEK